VGDTLGGRDFPFFGSFRFHPDRGFSGEDEDPVRPATLIIGNELDTLTSKGFSVPTEIGLDVGFKG
jgi:hypothetical protein